jgi:hypothetical protein
MRSVILPAIITWRFSTPRGVEIFHEVIAGSMNRSGKRSGWRAMSNSRRCSVASSTASTGATSRRTPSARWCSASRWQSRVERRRWGRSSLRNPVPPRNNRVRRHDSRRHPLRGRHPGRPGQDTVPRLHSAATGRRPADLVSHRGAPDGALGTCSLLGPVAGILPYNRRVLPDVDRRVTG